MITVLLDSSTTDLCVAVAKDNKVIASTKYFAWQEQSEYMIPELDKLLKDNNLDKNDINEVVVTIGPGSYTGVRIAVTIAKIMGVCLEIPVFTLSSLEVLKDGEQPSICLINARSNRSYIGVYEGTNCVVKDTIYTNDEVKDFISKHNNYSICGDVEYLGLKAKETNVFENMIRIKNSIKPIQDNLVIKPIYLKD